MKLKLIKSKEVKFNNPNCYFLNFDKETFYVIPHNKHKYNRVFHVSRENNLESKVVEIIEDDKISVDWMSKNIELSQKYLNLLMNLAKFDFSKLQLEYDFEFNFLLPIDIDFDIGEIMNAKITINNLRLFIDNLKQKIDDPRINEIEIEKFIYQNKSLFPFFKICEKEERHNDHGKEYRLDLTIQDFLSITTDLMELKLPSSKILSLFQTRQMFFWSDDVSKAISQVQNYINSLNHERIYKKNGEKYIFSNTKAYILMGRRYDKDHYNDVNKDEWFNKFCELNKSLENIKIMTYDDFIEKLEHIYNLFSRR